MGLLIRAFGRDMSPLPIPRIVVEHAFPLLGGAIPTVGAPARIIAIGRPLRVVSEGLVLYRDPGRSFGLERIYEPRDRRRRYRTFAAWGFAEAETARMIATAGPPADAFDEEHELVWWGVREYEGRSWSPVVSWHRGDPPEGRPYAESRRW